MGWGTLPLRREDGERKEENQSQSWISRRKARGIWDPQNFKKISMEMEGLSAFF